MEIKITLKGDKLKVQSSEAVDDALFLSMLIEAYLNEAKIAIEEHSCLGDNGCHFKKLNIAIVESVEHIISLHNKEHEK